MRRVLIGLFLVPLVSYGLLTVWLLFFILGSSYNECIDQIIGWVGEPQYGDLIKNTYLTESTFLIAQYLSLFISACLFLTLVVFFYKRKELRNFFQRVMKASFSDPNSKVKLISGSVVILFVLFFLRHVYFLWTYDITYDEAWSFLHFTYTHPILIFFSPNNNHIIYTFYSFIFHQFFDGDLAIRLPVILSSCLVVWIFARMIHYFFKGERIIGPLLLIMCLPAIGIYGFHGRGYIFEMLACLISVWSLLKMVQPETKDKRIYLAIACLANVFGIWSVPTHGILVIIECVFLVWIQPFKQGTKAAFFLSAFALLSSFILLPSWWAITLPALFTADITMNSTQSTTWWDYVNRVSDWLFFGGGRGKIIFPFVCIFLLLQGMILYNTRKKRLDSTYHFLLLSFLIAASPFIVSIFLPIFLPYRIWCFVGPFYCILFIGTVNYFQIHKQNRIVIYIGTSLFFSWISFQHYFINWSYDLDHKASVLSTTMMDQGVDTCYVFSTYDQPLIQYHYAKSEAKVTLYMRSPSSQFHRTLDVNFIPPFLLYDIEDYQSDVSENHFIDSHYQDTIYQDDRLILYKRANY